MAQGVLKEEGKRISVTTLGFGAHTHLHNIPNMTTSARDSLAVHGCAQGFDSKLDCDRALPSCQACLAGNAPCDYSNEGWEAGLKTLDQGLYNEHMKRKAASEPLL